MKNLRRKRDYATILHSSFFIKARLRALNSHLLLSAILCLNAQRSMRHSAETLGRNQLTGLAANAIRLVLNAH